MVDEVLVRSGTAGGVPWRLLVSPWGSSQCLILASDVERQRTCRPGGSSIRAARFALIHRVGGQTKDYVHFVVGALSEKVARVTVVSHRDLRVQPTAVSGYTTRFFVLPISAATRRVVLVALDASGEEIARVVVNDELIIGHD